jgi:hypothetical protein
VDASYSGGHLGAQNVRNLNELLFPQDLFPSKYDAYGAFIG